MKLKYCPKCENVLPTNMFAKSKSRYDGLQSQCKNCLNKYAKNYRKTIKGIAVYKKTNKKRYQTEKKIMHNLKINGCVICGYDKYDGALDFHHVNPEDKKFTLNQHWSNKSLTNELSKCILLCKNCHSEIHAKERGEKLNDT